MTGPSELYRGRTPLDVPWDPARERRVLGRALASCRRRARRMRALELCGAALMVVLLGRVLVRSSAKSDAVAPIGAPDASGGFAGTGGHGGGSSGLGGGAGTG